MTTIEITPQITRYKAQGLSIVLSELCVSIDIIDRARTERQSRSTSAMKAEYADLSLMQLQCLLALSRLKMLATVFEHASQDEQYASKIWRQINFN